MHRDEDLSKIPRTMLITANLFYFTIFPLGCPAMVPCEWLYQVVCLDVRAFDFCTRPFCVYCLSRLQFSYIGDTTEFDEQMFASSSVWDRVEREMKIWNGGRGFSDKCMSHSRKFFGYRRPKNGGISSAKDDLLYQCNPSGLLNRSSRFDFFPSPRRSFIWRVEHSSPLKRFKRNCSGYLTQFQKGASRDASKHGRNAGTAVLVQKGSTMILVEEFNINIKQPPFYKYCPGTFGYTLVFS